MIAVEPSSLSLKREVFRVKIRKQAHERQFQHYRLQLLNQIHEVRIQIYSKSSIVKKLQDLNLMLKDCLAQKLELSSDTFQAHIEVIYQCLMQTNQLVLLDVLNVANMLLKCANYDDVETALAENYFFQEIVFKINKLTQGYDQGGETGQLITIYGSKFLRRMLSVDLELNLKTFLADILETVYFLLLKQEMVYVQRGLEILKCLVDKYDAGLIPIIRSTQIGRKSILQILGEQLFSGFANKNTELRKQVWRIICKSCVIDEKCLECFLELKQSIKKQEITFFQILLDEILGEDLSLAILKNQLQIVYLIVQHNESYREKVRQSAIPQKVQDSWLFHDQNRISELAHEIQEELSIEQQ